MKHKPDATQTDLFHTPVYPSRMPTDTIECTGFSNRLARAMKRAADICPYDRHEIAFRMAQALEQDDFSKATLDAYISEAKTDHNISVKRYKAFVRATEQIWLWDFLVADEGCTVLVGDEVRLAEIQRLQQQRDVLDADLRRLKATPVNVTRRVRS
jgi:hypothetical protein